MFRIGTSGAELHIFSVYPYQIACVRRYLQIGFSAAIFKFLAECDIFFAVKILFPRPNPLRRAPNFFFHIANVSSPFHAILL